MEEQRAAGKRANLNNKAARGGGERSRVRSRDESRGAAGTACLKERCVAASALCMKAPGNNPSSNARPTSIQHTIIYVSCTWNSSALTITRSPTVLVPAAMPWHVRAMAAARLAENMKFCPKLSMDRDCCVLMAASCSNDGGKRRQRRQTPQNCLGTV